jgi:agmatinase
MSMPSVKHGLVAAALVAGMTAALISTGALHRNRAIAASPASQPLSAKLAHLAPDKKAFITDPRQLARFNLTLEKVEVAIANFDDAAVDTYVSALMAAVASNRYQQGDFTETEFNLKFPRINAGTTLRPAILDSYPREPGPFSLDRYVNQKTGIPTFAHAPVAVRKDDLVAGKVEVAFVGAPLDMSSGYRDAKHAPAFIRAMDGLSGIDPDTGINPNVALRLADYGNIAVDQMTAETSIAHIRTRVREIVSAGTVPFVVGGDHSVMYGDVAGTVDQLGKGSVGVVLIDAHAELAPGEHTISDNQAMRRLIADGIVPASNVVIVAIRDPGLSPQDRQQFERDGGRIYGMTEIRRMGWAKAVDGIVKDARKGARNVFVSFDISALDPAYAGGAGRPEPGGLDVIEAKDLARTLCAENHVVGFDMLDVAPVMDPTYRTTLNANSVMHSCLAGMAQRKMRQ